MVPDYYSISKPYYRGYFPTLQEELEKIGWNGRRLAVEYKYDGVRISPQKINGEGFIFVDPQDIKEKDPNISSRFPIIISELSKILPDNTVIDAEMIAVKDGQCLHRTVVNSIINSNETNLENYIRLVCFDILFFEGNDIRNQPQHERLEYLQRINSSEHIQIAKISTNLNELAEGYIINNYDELLKSVENIKKNNNNLK